MWIISKETYDNCCPRYKERITELEQKIGEIKHSDDFMATKLCEIIIKFSDSYLTPREYWKYLMQRITVDRVYGRIHFNDLKEWTKSSRNIAKRALFHLCYIEEWNAIPYNIQHDDGSISVYYFNAYGDTYLKLLNFQNDFYFESAKHKPDFTPYIVRSRDLEYPHVHLEESRIPSARYQKMKSLYHKIRSVEHNVEEWFYVLCETRDVAFVANNVEYCLGKWLFNIKLWKLYIHFLEKQRECKLLLETYSKYCRFFLDDKEMKENFKTEMARYGFSGVSMDKIYTY